MKQIIIGDDIIMNFLNEVCYRVIGKGARIVLPESEDDRILEAANIICRDNIADIVLLGEKEKIRRETEKKELYYLQQESIVDIHDDEFMELHMNLINEAKRIKNISQVQAEELLKNPLNVGALMVKSGYVDGMVAGATFHSRDVIMSALQFVGLSEDIVFSYNIMVSPNEEIGENGAIVLADCAINQSPDEVELADIAIRTAKEFNRIFYSEPKTAFMSCSTYGSSEGKEIEKIRRAIKLARDQEPEMIFDGEFQMDTAIIPEINLKKAPNSIIKGDANVMIFPDLNSGNLVYKTMQRFGNAESYGPIICGLCKPVNDLSRGCSVHDIIGVVSITALQCKNEE
ncbi:MAG: phosphate acyltransferase [Floccifex sp.]